MIVASIHFKLSLAEMAGCSVLKVDLVNSIELVVLLNDLNISLDDIGVVIKNDVWVKVEKCFIENNDEVFLFPNIQGG